MCLHQDSCMRNGKGWQTVRGNGRGAADARGSKGKKRYNTGNRAGYFGRRNAAIPARSTVQLIACVAPRRALSRVGPPVQAFLSRVVTQVSRRVEERAFACKICDWGPLNYTKTKTVNQWSHLLYISNTLLIISI